jgi:hypothetical protein
MLLLVSSGQYAMTMTAPFGMFAWSGVFFFLQLLCWSCSINVAGISKKLHFVDSYKKVKPDLTALISHIFIS